MRLFRPLAVFLLAAAACAEPASPRVVQRYKEMLVANPVEGVALERLWKNASESGQTEELIAEYGKAGGFASEMILGHLLRRAGRDEDAVTAYRRAAKIEPSSALPLLSLGHLESERARPKEAAVWLEKAAVLLQKDDARLPDALLQLGAAWSAAGEPAKAVGAWERTLEREPENLELRRRLANACAENNLRDAAIRHFDFIAEHAEPAERAQALQQIAKLHSAAGNHAEAMGALERAVKFTAPENWLRSELLGQMIRLSQRHHAEGDLERKWREQVEANPRDLGGYLQLVEFHERTGNLDQQRVWLEKITGLAPKNATYELRLARLLVQLDQLDDAAAHFDKLLAAQTRNTDLVFERARLDLRREDGSAARRRLAAMLAEHKEDETLRAKALEFFQEHRLLDLVEEHLRADAASGSEESVVALANFYFLQRRGDEARAALRQLFKPGDAKPAGAARHFRVAQILKGQGEFTAATAEAESAITLQPGVRESRILLGELRAALLQFAEARAAFEMAYALSRSDAERIEVDGKLFESFRASVPAVPEGRAQGSSAAAIVEGHIRELMDRANAEKDAAGWLRVARWKAWNGDKASAVTFAVKAAEMAPENPEPREFLARHAASNGDAPAAVVHLRELIELNPAGRDGYLREIAQIELQRGNADDALIVFEELVKSLPCNADALGDLAAAQERAGKMKEAVATWRKVLALVPGPRKREVSVSLLRVLEATGLHDEGASLLLRAVDETQDERERFGRFDELLLHCQRHGRLAWLQSIFEARRSKSADDYFSEVALGRVLKQRGERAAAFELFADAVFAAPNQAAALPDLIHEAEDLGRPDVAVRLQEQLTRVAPQEQADGFLKLAALQEKTGDLEGTEVTWARAVAKFPRDAEVLRRAADFHQQWGDRPRAATLLRKLVALDPTNVRAASDLGELEFGAGRLDDARDAFETVMKLTRPVAQRLFPSDKGDGPWSERGAFSDFRLRREWAGGRLFLSAAVARTAEPAGRPDADAEVRLNALRRLGEIARRLGGAALEKWIGEWAAVPDEQATEALWALYFSGARDRVLAWVAEMARKDPATIANRQAFIWMMIESAQYERLGAWLNDDARTAEDMELFSLAFATVAKSRPESVGPAMMRGLFPEGAHARLWQSAAELARARRMPEAIALGRRVFEKAASQRPAFARELARWHLSLGETDEARRVLAMACKSEGESFGSAVYAAMRDLYFLLPEDQRAAFIAQQFRATDENSTHGLIVRVLLHGIEGRADEARVALGRLLERRPMGAPAQEESNSAVREWNFFGSTVLQLIEWNLPDLARSAADFAFADDGLAGLQGQQRVRAQEAASGEARSEAWSQRPALGEFISRERWQREALSFLMTGRVERERMLAALHSHGEENELSKLGEAIELLHGGALAVDVFRRSWEQDPQNPKALRKLIESCKSADDSATAEAVRRRCLDERINPGNDTTPREFAIELADLLETRGAAQDAIGVIARAVERNPGELRLLHRQAQLLDRTGRIAEAEAIWRRLARTNGGTAHARAALAQRFEEEGEFSEAIEVRTRGGASGDSRLPVLLYKAGQTDEALAAFEKLSGSAAVYSAMTLAEAMGVKDEGKLARSVLVTAAAKNTDARGQMQLSSKLLTIPGFPPTPIFLARMQLRMRELAAQQPGLAEAYYEFFDHYAGRFGTGKDWEMEVATAWADGNGVGAAGVVLLRRECARGDAVAAKETCMRLLALPGLSGVTLEKLDALLEREHRPELRLLVAEANARGSWPYADGTLAWVRLLDAQGAREEARSVLARHGWLAGFAGGAKALGRSWLALGGAEQARTFLQAAMRENALAPPPPLLAAMARVHLGAKNLTAAGLLLRRAFAQPSCHEVDALVEYLDVAGELPQWQDAVREFGLSARTIHELKRALFSHFEKRGNLHAVIALIADERALVAPVGAFQIDGSLPAQITCERVRVLARKTGGFEEASEILEKLAAGNIPDAAPQLAALYADWAESGGEPAAALPHLDRAAALRPASWEFTRRSAEIRLSRHELAGARASLGRFLGVSQAALEREMAFDLWEKTNAAKVARQPGG